MRPQFLHIASWGWVALGGAVGAGAREALLLGMPDVGHLPWAVAVANLVGAFLLGLLYTVLAGTPAGAPSGRRLRLLLGTGFCGGFTTYSTLALGVVLLASSGALMWAVAYALGTVFLGALATWAGIAAGTLASTPVRDVPLAPRRGQR